MSEKDIMIVASILFFIAVAAYVCIGNNIRRKRAAEAAIRKSWGRRAGFKADSQVMDAISRYSLKNPSASRIDDITWNDLGMDDVFKAINNTNSSVGQEYLYKMLREPVCDRTQLTELDALAEGFTADEKTRIEIQKIFRWIGKTKKVALSDYIALLIDMKPGSNAVHYFSIIFIVAAVCVTVLVTPVLGIWLIIAAVAFSIITYYKYKSGVEGYFKCVNVLVKMADAAEKICEYNVDFLKKYTDRLESVVKGLHGVTKGAWAIESGNVDGSLAEVVLDYLRMLTHVDLIKFNSMTKHLADKNDEAYELIDTLGFIEASIAVASFRDSLPYWSRPHFKDTGNTMSVKEVFHPLIDKPVSNSIEADGNILLTGSNASGKSTFLKTIAINCILSQTLFTSVSKEYAAPVYRVYSSMALKDDLANSDSYYIVEIKSLKRILDAVKADGKPVICFIDEVLRGTNTVERIAASSEILRSLNSDKVMCFAATHDVELTSILKDCFANYHFQEEVTQDEVKFDYKLYYGPATTRNAIKLLKVIGYDASLVKGAEERAAYFLSEKSWKA